jgi:chromosome segregation ATPase
MIKVVLILLAVAAMILGMLYYHEVRYANDLREELAVASNQVVAAQEETVSVKSEMTKRVGELESIVAGVKKRKAQAEARVGELLARITAVEQDLQEEKNRVMAAEDQRNKLASQLASVSNKLAKVGEPPLVSRPPERDMQTLREHTAKLETEKALLERELNDPEALRARLRMVKRRQWQQRIEQWKREDEEAWLNGNWGVLFQNGQWQNGW